MNDDLIISTFTENMRTFTENVSTIVPGGALYIFEMNWLPPGARCAHSRIMEFQNWRMCLYCMMKQHLYESNWRILHVDGFEPKYRPWKDIDWSKGHLDGTISGRFRSEKTVGI